jgi:mono/diheme cytochrome c family protein
MRSFIRWTLRVLVGLVALGAVLFGIAWIKTERGMARTYAVADPPLTIARDAATLEHGAHLFATRGCADCHGADARGKVVFEAGPVMKIVGPNLTPGGVLKGVAPDRIAAAIRHGVKPDGRSVVFMPSEDFAQLGDADVAALVAWLQAQPASSNDPGPTEVRPVGRVLYALGKLPLLPAEHIDHAPRSRAVPALAATAEYGRYLAVGCTGCHGANFAGQHVPGTPASFPSARNLTPAALAAWTASDFRRALREGKRPDGTAIDTFMPWQTYARLKDEEIDALWTYLRTLPPKSGAG